METEKENIINDENCLNHITRKKRKGGFISFGKRAGIFSPIICLRLTARLFTIALPPAQCNRHIAYGARA